MKGFLIPAVAVLFLSGAVAQSMPPEMRNALVSDFHFSDSDIARIESGRAVAHMVPGATPDDVRMAGAVLIKISSDDFLRAYRDIAHFEVGREVRQTGRLSTPPTEADLAGYHLPDLTKDEIFACKPGKCSYKMPAEVMTDIREKVDWSAPDANQRAEAYIHKLMLAKLKDYQVRGDAALSVYNDSPAPYSVAQGLHSLLDGESRFGSNFPDLLQYAENYPKEKPANTEDMFYWQEAAFGLKHVLRVQHVIIEKLDKPVAPHYAIVSKMLYATHYFRAAVEFKYVYPVKTASGQPAVFFFSAQRSYVDGLTGTKGAILKRITESRSPASMVANMELAKQNLEASR